MHFVLFSNAMSIYYCVCTLESFFFYKIGTKEGYIEFVYSEHSRENTRTFLQRKRTKKVSIRA